MQKHGQRQVQARALALAQTQLAALQQIIETTVNRLVIGDVLFL